ncbi:MAG TPA: hypothetical protein VMH28_10930 [Candidatus Acidoferrales bacterium]|nr:hypothetical protein [Candidatus Acidoferrales bacterium]
MSRTFTISEAAMCGNVKLAPGTYRLIVDRNGKAEIVDRNHFTDHRPTMISGNVTKSGEKFTETRVKSENEGNGNVARLTEIDLGNSHTVVTFPQQ